MFDCSIIHICTVECVHNRQFALFPSLARLLCSDKNLSESHLPYLKGPVVSLRIEEVSLGRTKGAKKLYDGIARAAASAKWRLPFMVRGVHVVLRTPPVQNKPGGKGSRAWTLPKLTSRVLAQTLLSLLPFIPVRVKDIEVVHEVCLHLQLIR